jgi:hypothetical protein
MENSGESESGDTSFTSSGHGKIILEDTLSRKLPSLTLEKYIKQTKTDASQDVYEESHVEIIKKSFSEIGDGMDNSKVVDSNTSEFELNLDGGSPMLHKFQNPFEETPDAKKYQKDTENISTNVIFKTPSKSVESETPSNTSKLLNFFKNASINPAEEFRALQEKQLKDTGYGYQNLDTSNIGLIIDVRKSDDDINDDNSLDDSSIKLNLIPNTIRKTINERTNELAIATQADGNVHEEVNRISREQRSKQKLDEDDEDDQFYLIGNDVKSFQNFRYLSDIKNDEDDKKLYEDSNNFSKHISESNEIGRNNDENNANWKGPLELTGSNFNIDEETESSGKDQKFPANEKILIDNNSEKLDQKCSQELLGHENEYLNGNEIEKVNNNDDDGDHKKDNNNALKLSTIKETQVIENFSQSLVLDDDDDLEDDKSRKVGSEKDDDDDDILVGRNILQTFRINASQSQSQSQLHSQSQPLRSTQTKAQLRSRARSPSSINSVISKSQSNNDSHLQVTASEPNDIFDDLANEEQNVPDIVKIDQGNFTKDNYDTQLKINHVSSPVNLVKNFGSTPNEELDFVSDKAGNIDAEVPNTSTASISKIEIEMGDASKHSKSKDSQSKKNTQDYTSTPLSKSNKTTVQLNEIQQNELANTNKHSVIEKLVSVLNENVHGNISNINIPNNIEREYKGKKYEITDVLDCESVFFMNSSYRFPGRIIGILKSGDTIYVTLETKNDEVVIEYSKIYAPICFDIGDSVKYTLDKSSNYIITGLKNTTNDFLPNNKDDEIGKKISTVDGYDKILIRKNAKNKKKDTFSEIEVDIQDIYLTAILCRNYQYKLFNDQHNFQRYIDYQLSKFALTGKDGINGFLNPDDTLLNILPVNTETKSRNPSFMNNSQGAFYKCLFIVTGLSNNSRLGSSGDSKNNTPRHQKEKENLPVVIEFIKSQGGIVLQDSGFEDIIRFKKYNKTKRINSGINTSPRKAKMLMLMGMNNYDESNTELNFMKKLDKDFKNYKCFQNQKNYFHITFDDENECMEVDEAIKDFEFGCVLSTRHSRTLKYLECLCLKWPILHIELIKKCMNDVEFLQNWRNEWIKFQLIAGECSRLNCAIGIDCYSYYENWKLGRKLYQQIRLNNMFKGMKIIIINEKFEVFKKKSRTKSNFNESVKRRKVKRGEAKNESDYLIREGDSADSDSDEDPKDDEGEELAKNVSNTPVDVSTLLWIFKHIGFEETIIMKDNNNMKVSLEKLINKFVYIYFQHGNEIEKFLQILDVPSEQCVNWEWIVQSVICNSV